MKHYRLDSPRDTLVLVSTAGALPEIWYFGPRIDDEVDLETLAVLLQRPLAHGGLDVEETVSLVPEAGRGFCGWPGISAHRQGMEANTQFELREAHDRNGRWFFICEDAIASLRLIIDIALDPETSVVSAETVIHNMAEQPLTLDWLTAVGLSAPPRCDQVLSIGGHWGHEFQARRAALNDGAFVSESRVGRGSHHSFPGLVICEPDADDQRGEAVALHLGWSSNHRLLVERLRDGRVQAQIGELLMPGEQVLARNASYRTPRAYLARSSSGLNGIRRRYHAHLRRHLLPKTVAARPRPVYFNTWDALRFDHDPDALFELVELAADAGVERFVIDDGWFTGRDDDAAGLGDWTPCPRKYPQGLRPLVEAVRKQGMEFGLWVEPEMINRNSDLFRRHPDWVLGDGRREQPLGRNQYALDLTREDCRDHLFEQLASLVNDNDIAYLKWDMNRDLVHAVSGGRAAAHRQAVGVYELMDRLRARFPLLEIEACSSGGARADFEMCRRTDRIWVSDCHDPVERQRMQRAFSLFFPPEIMGSHVGPGACPVTHRAHDVYFKSVTALFGSFGIEADLRELTPEQRTELAQFIAMYRENRDWMHEGDFHYLAGLPGNDFVVCCNMAANQRRALISVALMKVPRCHVPCMLRVPGLDDKIDYEVRVMAPPIDSFAKRQPLLVNGKSMRVSANLLARVGVALPLMPPESALLIDIQPVSATRAAR